MVGLGVSVDVNGQVARTSHGICVLNCGSASFG